MRCAGFARTSVTLSQLTPILQIHAAWKRNLGLDQYAQLPPVTGVLAVCGLKFGRISPLIAKHFSLGYQRQNCELNIVRKGVTSCINTGDRAQETGNRKGKILALIPLVNTDWEAALDWL